jgi:hypothetical protein
VAPTPFEKPQSEPRFLDRIFLYQSRGRIGLYVFVAAVLIGGLESAPGWGLLGLNLNPILSTALASAAGIFAGAIGANYRVAGAICGGICGAGALGIFFVVLSTLERIPHIFAVLAVLFGCLPGMCIYWLVEKLLDRKANRVPDYWGRK